MPKYFEGIDTLFHSLPTSLTTNTNPSSVLESDPDTALDQPEQQQQPATSHPLTRALTQTIYNRGLSDAHLNHTTPNEYQPTHIIMAVLALGSLGAAVGSSLILARSGSTLKVKSGVRALLSSVQGRSLSTSASTLLPKPSASASATAANASPFGTLDWKTPVNHNASDSEVEAGAVNTHLADEAGADNDPNCIDNLNKKLNLTPGELFLGEVMHYRLTRPEKYGGKTGLEHLISRAKGGDVDPADVKKSIDEISRVVKAVRIGEKLSEVLNRGQMDVGRIPPEALVIESPEDYEYMQSATAYAFAATAIQAEVKADSGAAGAQAQAETTYAAQEQESEESKTKLSLDNLEHYIKIELDKEAADAAAGIKRSDSSSVATGSKVWFEGNQFGYEPASDAPLDNPAHIPHPAIFNSFDEGIQMARQLNAKSEVYTAKIDPIDHEEIIDSIEHCGKVEIWFDEPTHIRKMEAEGSVWTVQPWKVRVGLFYEEGDASYFSTELIVRSINIPQEIQLQRADGETYRAPIEFSRAGKFVVQNYADAEANPWDMGEDAEGEGSRFSASA